MIGKFSVCTKIKDGLSGLGSDDSDNKIVCPNCKGDIVYTGRDLSSVLCGVDAYCKCEWIVSMSFTRTGKHGRRGDEQ
jgi:ssDNA-binding Zn-finger/Zn-ribbon topoisomerase 1